MAHNATLSPSGNCLQDSLQQPTLQQHKMIFLREAPLNGLDAVAFHYSFYRAMSRFLGMDGNLQVVDAKFVTASGIWLSILRRSK